MLFLIREVLAYLRLDEMFASTASAANADSHGGSGPDGNEMPSEDGPPKQAQEQLPLEIAKFKAEVSIISISPSLSLSLPLPPSPSPSPSLSLSLPSD